MRCEEGSSPVLALARNVAEAIVLIAPERVEATRALINGLVLEIPNRTPALCRIEAGRKRIELTRKMLEHLWCCSYAYWILYSTHVAGKMFVTPTTVDLTEDAKTKSAMQLLRWSLNDCLTGNDTQWPETLPRPTANPAHASDEHVANEIMLCAAAFLLHHELAHHRLRHTYLPSGPASIEQEREADYEAAGWILGGCEGQTLMKRAVGTAIALSILVAERIHLGSDEARSHPRSFDRLINTLQRHIRDPNHVAWGISIVILKLHMDKMHVDAPVKVYDSFKDVAEAYAEVLAARTAVDQAPR